MNGLTLFMPRLLSMLVVWLAASTALPAAEIEPAPAGAYNRGFDPSLVQAWKEAKVPPPAYPSDADLLPVPTGAADTLRVYVDTKSITRADDFVLRVTYVVESRSGVRNIFFEGFRCEKGEYKTYAIGSAEKTLVPVKNPAWQDIIKPSANAFRHHLRQHACDISSARAPDKFLQHIKIGQ